MGLSHESVDSPFFGEGGRNLAGPFQALLDSLLSEQLGLECRLSDLESYLQPGLEQDCAGS